jgi:hypothetical protein
LRSQRNMDSLRGREKCENCSTYVDVVEEDMRKNEKFNRDNQRKCSILLQIFGTVRPSLPHWGM